ncbi:hypothetical protein C172_26435 [Paenibacillus sp. FSL H8-457]|nr:hypothetical protein C172_26435 [Paenibacillus sp. FSL H8-457]
MKMWVMVMLMAVMIRLWFPLLITLNAMALLIHFGLLPFIMR